MASEAEAKVAHLPPGRIPTRRTARALRSPPVSSKKNRKGPGNPTDRGGKAGMGGKSKGKGSAKGGTGGKGKGKGAGGNTKPRGRGLGGKSRGPK